jgi:murein DD-endopeptidase MepM/ murein hydrolase activator NlpD
MKNSYFLKKKISATVKSLGLFLVKALVSFYKFAFAKRTILFVTNNKIRTFTLGPIPQICTLLFLVWVGNIFAQTMRYDEVIEAKAEEISKLRSANNYFEDEFEEVNEKLKKINEYLASITGNAQAVKGEESQFKQPKNFKEEDLSRRDKHTLNQIKDVESQLSTIQSITQTRIKKIENAMAVTGLNIKKIPPKALQKKSGEVKEISLNGKKGIIDRQGGPLDLDSHSMDSMIVSNASEESLEEHLENIKFSSELDYLMVLEKIAIVMPFAKPMKNYYISSGFGTRADPITGRMASHHGLDFVGVTNEKIISPSKGKVILAGQFSGYGNAIVIDHGFGVTTRYGHLSAVKVTEGQMVKQGDVIALQGSTGRSTGAHLHYEVRYKNIPLNPRRFLEAGESLFNDDKSAKYANS